MDLHLHKKALELLRLLISQVGLRGDRVKRQSEFTLGALLWLGDFSEGGTCLKTRLAELKPSPVVQGASGLVLQVVACLCVKH